MKPETKIDKLRYDFLPSALEIIEKPASPVGKILIWVIFLMIISAITWAVIGEVDTVAVARGKIIPDGNIKVLQSANTAIITGINVIEGQTVKAGEVLIELDDTIARSDYDSIQSKLEIAQVEKELLIAYQDGENIDEKVASFNQEGILINPLFIESLKAYNAVKNANDDENKQAYELEIQQANQTITMAYSELNKINIQIGIVDSQIAKLKVLYDLGTVSQIEYQSKVDEKSILLQTKQTQYESIQYYKDLKETSEQKVDLFTSSKNIEVYKEIILKDKEIMDLNQSVEIAQKRVEMTQLKSPVDGMVQGIGNNTLGGVITSAQPIMSIVPKDTPLILEIMVLNRDVGFITEDMIVEIKLDTFPYQKYGSIEGRIMRISPDAIEKEGMGYVYKVYVTFEQTEIKLDNRMVKVTPGMTATAEIKLKKRRIIEFFIPAIDYVKDSVKLR